MIDTSYNKDISQERKANLNNHLLEQVSILVLKSFSNVLELLSCALNNPLNVMPEFLWKFQAQVDIEEEQLLRIVIPKFERTFWINKVIPIFRVQSVIDTDGARKNISGLGYDFQRQDLFVLEAASRTKKKGIVNTKDDTLKSIHSAVYLLSVLIRKNYDRAGILMTYDERFKWLKVQTMTVEVTVLPTNEAAPFSPVVEDHNTETP
ncbi:hypothetical protein AB4K20DRAFT_1807815 [Rhizopus microsporus]|uniref:Uncharacterized protein n=1 Tax=Rhizopus microsporus TaxID=58291 RepID=A0A1X0RMD7_RHIZD|nr:hypothetical protein BCV71DRAFT_268561 [Rhizopus microsporus]